MKCPRCGFVYNGVLDECPYCGLRFEGEEDFLSQKVNLNPNFSVKRSTIFRVLGVNAFLLIVFLDGVLTHFSSGMTIAGYAALFFGAVLLLLLTKKRNGILSLYLRIDAYFVLGLLIGYLTLGGWFVGGDMRPLIASTITPIYFIASTTAIFLTLFFFHPKIRVLEFALNFPFRLILISIIFGFTLARDINPALPMLGLFYDRATCPWGDPSIFNQTARILIFVAFGVSAASTFNFGIYAALRVLSKVHYSYGP